MNPAVIRKLMKRAMPAQTPQEAKYCVAEHTAKTKRILINHCRKERRHLHDQNSISHFMCIPWRGSRVREKSETPKYGVQGIEIGWLALTNYYRSIEQI
jgi:hypothetical protein